MSANLTDDLVNTTALSTSPLFICPTSPGICLTSDITVPLYRIGLLFGIPFLISILLLYKSLSKHGFNWTLFPSSVLLDWSSSKNSIGPPGHVNDSKFDFYLFFFQLAHGATALFVMGSIACITAAFMIEIDYYFGITFLYVLVESILITAALLKWRSSHWILTPFIQRMFYVAAGIFVAMEVSRIYYSMPYSYTGMSSMFLCLNFIPTSILLYYVASSPIRLSLRSFYGMDTSLIKDLHVNLKESIAMPGSTSTQQDSSVVMKIEPEPSLESHATPELQVKSLRRRQQEMTLSYTWMFALYALSVCILVAYGIVCEYVGFGSNGWITSATIILLDLIGFLTFYSGSSPLTVCILFFMVRIFFIIFGLSNYLVGHSLLFIIFSIFLIIRLIDVGYPLKLTRRIPHKRTTATNSESDGNGWSRSQINETAQMAQEASNTNVSTSIFYDNENIADPSKPPPSSSGPIDSTVYEGLESSMASRPSPTSIISLIVSLWILVMVYAADVGLTGYLSSTTVPGGFTDSKEVSVGIWILGPLSAAVVLFVTGGKLALRVWWNNEFVLTRMVVSLVTLMYACQFGLCAGYIYSQGDWIGPTIVILGYPIIVVFLLICSHFIVTDFHIFTPSECRNPPRAPSYCWAFLRCYLPPTDYNIFLYYTLEVGLIAAIGIILTLYTTPIYLGPTVSLSIFILFTTLLPLWEWFNTFAFSTHMMVQLGISICTLIIGGLLLFVYALDATLNSSAFLLLIIVCLYPTLVCLTLGVYHWWDSQWKLDEFTVYSLFLSCIFTLLFFFIITIFYEPVEVGLVGLIVVSIFLFYVLIVPSIKKTHLIVYHIIWLFTMGIIVGFAIGIGLDYDSTGFLGFSLLCLFLVVLLVIYSMYQHYWTALRCSVSIHDEYQVFYSSCIFPIYEYRSTMVSPGDDSPTLYQVNSRVFALYTACLIVYLWGIFSEFFIGILSYGQVASSCAIIVALIYSHQLRYLYGENIETLSEYVDYTDEGSEEYMKIVIQSKWNAARIHLIPSLTLPGAAGQNPKIGAEVGIQQLLQGQSSKSTSLESASINKILARLQEIEISESSSQTFDLMEYLSTRIPSGTRLCSLGFRVHYHTIDWFGTDLSRRECLWLLLHLQEKGRVFYLREERNAVQIHAEFIKITQQMKFQRAMEIVTMRKERGDEHISVPFVLALHETSAFMQQLKAEWQHWKYQRDFYVKKRQAERESKERQHQQRRNQLMEHQRLQSLIFKEWSGTEAATYALRRQEEMNKIYSYGQGLPDHWKIQQENDIKRRYQKELDTFQMHAHEAVKGEVGLIEEKKKEVERRKRILIKRQQQRELYNMKRQLETQQQEQHEQRQLQEIDQYANMKSSSAGQTVRKAEVEDDDDDVDPIEKKKIETSKQREVDAVTDEFQKAKGESEQQIDVKTKEFEEKHEKPFQSIPKEEKEKNSSLVEKFHQTKKSFEEWRGKMKDHIENLKKEHNKKKEEIQKIHKEKMEKAKNDKEKLKSSSPTDLEAKKEEILKGKKSREDEQHESKRKELESVDKENKKFDKLRAIEEKLHLKHAEIQQKPLKLVEEKKKELSIKQSIALSQVQPASSKLPPPAIHKELQTATEEEMKEFQLLDSQLKKSPVPLCSFKISPDPFVLQTIYRCMDCEASTPPSHGGMYGICVSCRLHCHAGHKVVKLEDGPMKYSCECGSTNSRCQGMKGSTKENAACINGAVQAQLAFNANTDEVDPTKEIRSRCAADNKIYMDEEFPHSDASLFIDAAHPSNPMWVNAQWRRIPDICPGYQLLHPPCDADDVRQGKIGNCWFLSAMSVLTLKSRILFGSFTSHEVNKEGVYAVRFYHNGKVIHVIVDDWIPVREISKAGVKMTVPLFAQLGESNNIWPIIMEKAFAKLHHSYESIEGGWVDSALQSMTGGVAERITWSDPKVQQSLHDGSLWTLLLQYYSQGFLQGAGSPVGKSDSESDASADGIIQSHAYSILKLQLVDGHQLIRLRNPWGRKEWTGDWGDHSSLWTQRLKSLVNFVDADDGAFWMSWQDFTTHFDEVYVCRFFDPIKWPSRGSAQSEWNKGNSGGCCNHPTVGINPQWAIIPLENTPTDICIEMIQEDTRGEKGKTIGEFPMIILELYDNKGKPVQQGRRGKLIANSGQPSQSVHIQTTIPGQSAGKMYTLLTCTYEPGVLASFTIRWNASATVKVQQYQSNGADGYQMKDVAGEGADVKELEGETAVGDGPNETMPLVGIQVDGNRPTGNTSSVPVNSSLTSTLTGTKISLPIQEEKESKQPSQIEMAPTGNANNPRITPYNPDDQQVLSATSTSLDLKDQESMNLPSFHEEKEQLLDFKSNVSDSKGPSTSGTSDSMIGSMGLISSQPTGPTPQGTTKFEF